MLRHQNKIVKNLKHISKSPNTASIWWWSSSFLHSIQTNSNRNVDLILGYKINWHSITGNLNLANKWLFKWSLRPILVNWCVNSIYYVTFPTPVHTNSSYNNTFTAKEDRIEKLTIPSRYMYNFDNIHPRRCNVCILYSVHSILE